jgi:hypothetical protein
MLYPDLIWLGVINLVFTSAVLCRILVGERRTGRNLTRLRELLLKTDEVLHVVHSHAAEIPRGLEELKGLMCSAGRDSTPPTTPPGG